MIVLISALAFFVLLSFLVLIHELGHFVAARKSGVVVEEFGFGLPPRAKELFARGGTVFSLNWIPFGGFVRLRGENALDDKERRRTGSFGRATFLQKLLILTAGVLMNFVVAMVIFTLGFTFWKWVPTYVTPEAVRSAVVRGEILQEAGVRVAQLIPDGAAAKAGLQPGSTLLQVEGKDVFAPRDVLAAQQGLEVARYILKLPSGEQISTSVRLDAGKAGVVLESMPVTAPRQSIFKGFALALREAGTMTVQTVKGLGQLGFSLVTRGRVPEGVTGIVGIAVMTHDTVQHGFLEYLRLVAVLSLSLAILNILPFPALDGGRVVFAVYEFLFRQPAPRRFELLTNGAGFLFLIGLILFITYHDILSLFVS